MGVCFVCLVCLCFGLVGLSWGFGLIVCFCFMVLFCVCELFLCCFDWCCSLIGLLFGFWNLVVMFGVGLVADWIVFIGLDYVCGCVFLFVCLGLML